MKLAAYQLGLALLLLSTTAQSQQVLTTPIGAGALTAGEKKVLAKSCADCPQGKPCGYSVPAGDGCNSCSAEAYCIGGQWYQTPFGMCTLRACWREYKILNPFETKEKP